LISLLDLTYGGGERRKKTYEKTATLFENFGTTVFYLLTLLSPNQNQAKFRANILGHKILHGGIREGYNHALNPIDQIFLVTKFSMVQSVTPSLRLGFCFFLYYTISFKALTSSSVYGIGIYVLHYFIFILFKKKLVLTQQPCIKKYLKAKERRIIITQIFHHAKI
jgi:hypothetical protein